MRGKKVCKKAVAVFLQELARWREQGRNLTITQARRSVAAGYLEVST